MQRRGVSSRIAVALHEVDTFHDGAPNGGGNGSGNGSGKSNGGDKAARPDPAQRQRIAGEEQVGFS